MSQVIDEKVVEMKFDNSNFEKNVEESLKTLKRLEEKVDSLEKTSLNLDKIGHAVDGINLSKLGDSLDAITHRFSVMGQVGASVIHNITSDVYNAVKNFGANIWNTTFGQIKSGGISRSRNIAEAQFRIEGLGLNYEDYYKSIDDAVSGTAYGFDEAAVAASQFASSGIKAGKDMDHALRSISGMAAMTGRSYTDLASVMEDAAALGKVTNDTFTRLSERGLAALQEYAKRTNQTVDDVRKLAKEGKISFEEFSKAMDEAYGEHATKADDTFTGVTSNIRAQLSRIGQAFYEPLITNNSDVVEMLKSVKAQIKAIKAYTDPLAKAMANYVLKLSRWGKGVIDSIDVSKSKPFFDNLITVFDNITKAAENLYTNILKPFGSQFKAAFYEVFPSLDTGKGLIVTLSDKLVDLSKRFREFTADIGLFGDKGVALKEVLVGILTVVKAVFAVLKTVGKIIGMVLGNVGKLTGGLASAIAGLMEFVNIATKVGYNIIAGIGTGLTMGLSVITAAVVNVAHLIIDTFCKVLGIHSPSTEARDQIGKQIIAGIAEGILYGLKVVSSAIQTAVSWILENLVGILSKVFSSVSEVVVKAFSAAFDIMSRVLNAFVDAVNRVDTSKLKEILNFVTNIVVVAAQLLILLRVANAVNSAAMAAWNFARAARKLATAIELFTAQFAIKRIAILIGQFANVFKSLAIAMATFSAAGIVFAVMIKNGYLPELLAGLGMMVAIVLELGIVVALVAKIDGSQLRGAAVAFAGFGAAIWAVATGVKKLGGMKWYEILAGVVSLGVVIGVLAVIAKKLCNSEAWYSQINYKLILGFAAGIWLIAGSIRRLGKMKPEDLLKGAGTIAVVTAIFGLFSVLLVGASKLKFGGDLSEKSFTSLAIAFLAFGVTIKMLAKAIVALGFIKQDALEQGMFIVSLLMTLLTVMMIAARFVAAEVTSFLAAISLTIIAMAASIKILGEMRDGISQGLAVLTVIMLEIAAFTIVIGKIKPNMGSLASLAFVSAMLLAMTGVIKVLGEMDIHDLIQGAASLAVLIAVLTGVIVLWGKLTKLFNTNNTFELTFVNKKGSFFGDQKNNKKAFKEKIAYIKTIVRSVAEVALVMAAVSKLIKNPAELTTSIIVMIGAFAGIMLVVNQLSHIGGDKDKSLKGMASAMRAIAAVLLVVGADLILLSQMPIPGLLAAGFVIAGILAVIGYIAKQSKVFGVQGMDPKPIRAAAMVIIAIGAAMTAMVYVAKDANPWLVIAIAGGLSLALFAIYKAIQGVGKIKMNWKSGAGIILAVSSLIVVAGAIAILAQFAWQDYAVGLGASVLAIVALTLLAKSLGGTNWKSFAKGSAIMLMACLPLIAVAGVVAIISNYDWKQYGPGLLSMSLAIGILGVVALLIGKFAGGKALLGAATLAILSLTLIPVAIAIQMIAEYDWRSFGPSLGFMVAAISVLGIVAAIAGTLSGGIGMIAGAASLAILSLTLIPVAVAISMIASYDWKSFGPSLGFMVAAISVLGIVAAVAGTLSAGVGMLAGAVSLAIVAAALIPVAVAVSMIASYDWQTIGANLGMMVAALSVLAIVAAIAGTLSAGVGIIAGAAAILILAGAVWVISYAFQNFAQVVFAYFTPEQAQQIVGFFDTLNQGIAILAESLMVNLEAAVATIREHVPILKEEISGLVDSLADAMTELAQQIEIRGKEVVNAVGDMVDGIKGEIEKRFGINSPSKYMADIGKWLMVGLKEGIKATVKAPIEAIKSAGSWLIETFQNIVGVHSMSKVFYWIGSWLLPGVTKALGDTSPEMFSAAESAGSGLVESFKSGASDLLNGNLSGSIGEALNNIFSGLDIEALKNGDLSGLISGLAQNGVSLDSLGGDSLTKFIDKLKSAGIEGSALTDILKTLGISIDDLGDSDLAKSLGLDEAKEGAEDVKTSIQELADEIIKGNFGNAPERWDRMFDHLVEAGMTAQEAYAAIADAQNEVNKRLGSSVVHNADEMEKKVSESAKKAAGAASNAKKEVVKAQEGAVVYGTDEYYKQTGKNGATLNNLDSGAKRQAEIEAYKQKLANEHRITLKEKENALAEIAANNQIRANSTLTEEARKQLDAEDTRNRKVLETYETQQNMIKAIQEQETATKNATTAEKQREDQIKKSNGAVVYGTDEYYKQTGKTGKTINTVAARPQTQTQTQVVKTETKVETKPVQTETKVEVTPKFEVKDVDVTALKDNVTKAVETEMKNIKAVAEIKPKIDMIDAKKAVQDFESTCKNLKSSIPDTFSNISKEVAKHFSTIASTITQEGSKITNNTKTAFQNAISGAVTLLNGKETINKFYNAGKSAAQGYAKGLRDKAALASIRSAGATIGNTSAKAVKASIKSNSPSKVFMEIGEFAGIGYGNGIANTVSYVSSASEKMADASVDQLFGAVTAIQSAVEDGMDLTPTIVPVIDASQIQNGLSSINSAVGSSQADITSITANMTAKASYDNSQVEEMRNRMDGMTTAFNDLATIMSNQPTPEVTANVNLMGDADGVFKLVQQSNSRYTKMHGKSAFA